MGGWGEVVSQNGSSSCYVSAEEMKEARNVGFDGVEVGEWWWFVQWSGLVGIGTGSIPPSCTTFE